VAIFLGISPAFSIPAATFRFFINKFVHEFYPAPLDNNKDPLHDTFGWVDPEYHLKSWALGCLQLHKMYGNVNLYGNTPAVQLLIDTL